MKSIYALKPLFQNLLRPLCHHLVQWKISANQVTLTAMLLSVVIAILIAWQIDKPIIFLLLPPILLIRMALNAIDGLMAREYAMQTPLGAILNELGDVISDTALYLPFALLATISPILIILLISLSIISEMTGVVAVQIGASRRYDGPMGKSDRAFIFGVIGLLLGLNIQAGLWLNIIFGMMLILLIVTIINRARNALKEISVNQ